MIISKYTTAQMVRDFVSALAVLGFFGSIVVVLSVLS